MDRCHQARVRNALEPEWEARFEPESYGFRPGRGCQDAIEAIFTDAARHDAPSGCGCWTRTWPRRSTGSTTTTYSPRSATFPARGMIRDWLKAGVFEPGKGSPRPRRELLKAG